MEQDLLMGIYSYLTTKLTYGKFISQDPNIQIELNNTLTKPFSVTFGNITYEFQYLTHTSNIDSGYQGYAYLNKTTNDIIIVHEGSESLTGNGPFDEKIKDWAYTNFSQIARGEIPEQFYDSNIFLNQIRSAYPNSTIKQVGMSLGGTLAEMNAALVGNENIETYTFNSYGANPLIPALNEAGFSLSNNYSNIYNFRYKNELLTTIAPHIGNLYESSFIETQKAPIIHSIETYYENALTYNLNNTPIFNDTISLSDYDINITYDGFNKRLSFETTSPSGLIISPEIYSVYLEPLYKYGYLGTILVGEISINNEIYNIKSGDTMWDISNRFGISQEDLIEANPWLADRYSEDKSFALIRPDEQLIIPEGSIKGTDNSQILDETTKLLKEEYIKRDTIAPEGVTLPASGKDDNSVVQHYTTKPGMLFSDSELFLIALNTGDEEAVKALLTRIPPEEATKITRSWFYNSGYSRELAQSIQNTISTIPNIGNWSGFDIRNQIDFWENIIHNCKLLYTIY